MDRSLAATLVVDFFIAFGVIIGGAIIGGISAFIIGEPPLKTISELASNLKIWAIVAAIGGTFDAVTSIERGIFTGAHDDILKTLLMVFAALCGAQSGTTIIQWITQEHLSR